MSGWTNLGQEYVLPGSIWWCYGALLLMPMVIHRLIQMMDYVGSTMGAAGCALWVLGDAIHRLDPSSLFDDLLLIFTGVNQNYRGLRYGYEYWPKYTNELTYFPSNIFDRLFLRPNYLFKSLHGFIVNTGRVLLLSVWSSSSLFYGLAATRFGFRIVEKLTGRYRQIRMLYGRLHPPWVLC